MSVLDRAVVATDSEEVAEICRALGAPVEMTSSDHLSGTDRVAEVADRSEYRDFDFIVNVQGDEPLLKEAHVRATIDLVRDGRRTESLDVDDSVQGGHLPVRDTATVEATDPDHARYARLFQQALQEALGSLDPRDRLRLSYYYVQSLTLAETGRLLKEHEATVSRKLARARKQLRLAIEHTMKDRHRLTPDEINLCYQCVVEDGSVDLSGALR